MVSRKLRTRVVFDTNVIAAFYLSRNARSANATTFKMWRDQRLLELVVCDEVVQEYVDTLQRLEVHPLSIERFIARLEARSTVSWINLGPRVVASRDPDDNVFLSTATTGQVAYLVTNDHDLLELPDSEQKKLRFDIARPATFLAALAEK